MSLKSIELQIALPKTFEAGKLQEQAQQQIHAGQDIANEALKKQLEKNKTLLLESAEIKNLSQDDPKKESENEKERQELERQKQRENRAKHPFKGNLFDYSG